AMGAALELLLAVVCALGWGSVWSMPQQAAVPWRLELEPYVSAPLRIRRQAAFPGTGMPCLTVTFLTEMKGRFAERIDPNDDGKATFNEVRNYLRNFKPTVTDDQVTSFIRRRDLNGNRIIEFIPEYILDIATPDMTAEAAAEWFALEDSDGDGFVTRRELLRIAQQLGMSPDQADGSVSSYYMAMDTNGDDRLSFDGQYHKITVCE
ncbi:hypothetical protein BaRGS_00028141, partial [Batillaria attramentaria]